MKGLVWWTVATYVLIRVSSFSAPRIGVTAKSRLCLSEKTNDEQDDGDDLTKQFYDQVRKRGLDKESSDEVEKEETIKFTGKSTPAPASPRFTERSLFDPQVSSSASTDSNLQREREREFNLSSLFQKTLPFQAAFLALSLAFVVYVGITGGITDGSDRVYDDEVDVDIEYLNRIRTDTSGEIPTDPAQSSSTKGGVWL